MTCSLDCIFMLIKARFDVCRNLKNNIYFHFIIILLAELINALSIIYQYPCNVNSQNGSTPLLSHRKFTIGDLIII